MTRHLRVAGLLTIGLLAEAMSVPNAETLLKAAEEIRNPSEEYKTDVVLTDTVDTKKEVRTYEVMLKNRDRALVRFLTPAVDSGTKILMIGNEMWVYVPSSAKPLRVPARQKLTGNASYGDITRLSFVGNYTPKFVKEDKVGDRAAYLLELTSIDGKAVTYDRIQYWIDKANNRPLKTLYQTSSGKTLKEGTFGQYEKVFGVDRPSLFTIKDYLKKSHTTTLLFKSAKKADLPDLIFEKQNLGRN